MRSICLLSTFVALTLAAPRPVPQVMALEEIADFPAPSFYTPPDNVVSQVPTLLPSSVLAASVSANIATEPAVAPTATAIAVKRDGGSNTYWSTYSPTNVTSKAKRDGTCALQPAGAGPVATPDTPSAFASNSVLWVSSRASH